MKTFKIYASETVIYNTVKIKADNFEQASSKYLDLFANENTAPRITDSYSFETSEEQ